MTRIGKNPLTRALYRSYVSLMRSSGLSINDMVKINIRVGLPRSSRTLSKLIDRVKVRGGDLEKYLRIMVKLEKTGRNITKWISYILSTKTTEIPSIEDILEKELEPP